MDNGILSENIIQKIVYLNSVRKFVDDNDYCLDSDVLGDIEYELDRLKNEIIIELTANFVLNEKRGEDGNSNKI